MLADPEGTRLTGTHARFTAEQIRRGLASAKDRHDRADWAIVAREEGTVLGEAVLNDFSEDNASMGFRISLVGPQVFGRGYCWDGEWHDAIRMSILASDPRPAST